MISRNYIRKGRYKGQITHLENKKQITKKFLNVSIYTFEYCPLKQNALC